MNFDCKIGYSLENERVLLRPLEADDIKNLLDYSLNEPEIWWHNLIGARGKENLEKYIRTTLDEREKGKEYAFIVFDKTKNKYAGSTRFYEISNDFSRMELGYTWYGKEFQGSGLNKNCKYLMLEFAFEKMGAIRVGFGANSKNEKSIAAMKSIGCTVEGILRAYGRDAEGRVTDSIRLSILKEEWFSRVKTNLREQARITGLS